MQITVIFLLVIYVDITESTFEALSVEDRTISHRYAKSAANCILRIAERDFGTWKYVGITSIFNMTAPAAEMQRIVIKTLNSSLRWLLEVILYSLLMQLNYDQ